MVSTYNEFKKGIADRKETRINDRARHKGRGRDWCSFGAIAGLAGGIIVALIGSVLTAITWFSGTGAGISYIHILGTILLFMTIPLLIIGAHCLDLTERQAEKARNARSNQKSIYGRSHQGREHQ